MARNVAIDFVLVSPEVAPELCVHLLIAASQVFEAVPEGETPARLIELLKENTASPFVLGPGRLWIEAITAAYEAAAREDGE